MLWWQSQEQIFVTNRIFAFNVYTTRLHLSTVFVPRWTIIYYTDSIGVATCMQTKYWYNKVEAPHAANMLHMYILLRTSVSQTYIVDILYILLKNIFEHPMVCGNTLVNWRDILLFTYAKSNRQIQRITFFLYMYVLDFHNQLRNM